jgi:hypothetical protein
MQLRDVMTPKGEVIPPDATIGDAAKKMKELDLGAASSDRMDDGQKEPMRWMRRRRRERFHHFCSRWGSFLLTDPLNWKAEGDAVLGGDSAKLGKSITWRSVTETGRREKDEEDEDEDDDSDTHGEEPKPSEQEDDDEDEEDEEP